MFEIELRNVDRESLEWEERIDDPHLRWADFPAAFAGPLDLAARAELTGDGSLHVAGRLRATLRLTCRRCLEEVAEELSVPFDVSFRSGAAADEEGVWPLEPEGGRVDLAPALREELLLALPEYPLCRPDCQGLCPSCGARRGDEACDCGSEETDPRWDALRGLRPLGGADGD